MQIIVDGNIIQTTLVCSVLILVLLLLRFISIRFSAKRIFVAIWVGILFRLLIPLRLNFFLSADWAKDLEKLGRDLDALTGSLVVRGLWLFGAVFVAGSFFLSYYRCKRVLGTSLPIGKLPAVEEDLFVFMGVDVYISDRIVSPITYGFLKQKILIPKIFMDLPREQLKYVLVHEKIHIERHDNLRKFLMVAAVCLYWFNPFVWLMYFFYNRDIEISCDEKVLKRVGAENREGYATALIYLAEHGKSSVIGKGTVNMYSGFGQNAIRERIGFIMKYRRRPGMAIICAILMALPLLLSFAAVSPVREPMKTEGMTSLQNTGDPVVYGHVGQVVKELSTDPYKNTVVVTVKNEDGVKICFRIWFDRGYAECHGRSFSDNIGNESDWQPGVDAGLKGKLRIPDAVAYDGRAYPVQVLGDYSFYKCKKIEEIELPSGITRILKFAFYGCESLKEIKLPATVEQIEKNPFGHCFSLKRIEIDSDGRKANYTSRDGILYSDFGRYLKVYPLGRKTKHFKIPGDVTRIARRACYRARFSTVSIPESVYLIHSEAFRKCQNMTSCRVPKKAKVAKNAFDSGVVIWRK